MEILKVDLDHLKKSNWTEQELKNAEIMTDFIQHLMNNHDFEYVNKTYGKGAYIQHSRGIADGMEGVINTIKQLIKRYPDYTYDVKKMYADGNYIIFHSHATINKKHRGNDKKGLNIIDTWRIVNGEIVEHWDAIQPLDRMMRFAVWLNGGAVRNTNGIF